MAPLISIIIPIYNSAQFMSETIESALNQTYKPLEVIVVDDGSIDNTKDILRAYLSRINYIYKENGGPASARNLGIKNAKGEYIAFLDSDDIWLPEKLKKQINAFLEDRLIGLVHCQCRGFKNDINEILTKKRKSNLSRVAGDIFPSLFWSNFIVNSSVMVKSECFQKVGLFDENKDFISVEDYDMWLRITKEYKVGYIDELLTGYRAHPNGISRKTDISYSREKLVIEKTVANYPDIENITGVKVSDRFSKLYLDYGLGLIEEEKLKEAKENFFISFRYNPFNTKSLINLIKCSIPFKIFMILKKIERKSIYYTRVLKLQFKEEN